MCKPLAEEHLRANYGDVKRLEEKRRRVTLGAGPSPASRHAQSALDISLPTYLNANGGSPIVIDRPDTNTFVANRSVSSATLGRKTSAFGWGTLGSPSRFRSLGGRNNGTATLDSAARRRSEHNPPYVHTPLNVRTRFTKIHWPYFA